MLLAKAYSVYRHVKFETVQRRVPGLMAAALMATVTASNPALGASSPPLDPSGFWSTKDNESIIRISPCARPPAYCGTLVWLKEPLEKGVPKTDKSNPDPAKKSRPLVGLELLTELSADEDHWKGKAYNAEDGKVYDITFKVIPDKEKGDKGEIRGCVLRYLCKSETFVKVQTVPGGDPTLPNAAVPPHAAAPASPPAAAHH